MTFNEYKIALKNNVRQPIFKVEWLDEDENVVDEITNDIISGQINIDYKNGIRRDCNLNIVNNLLTYNPDPDGKIYLNKKFKLYQGIIYNGEEYYTEQGIFNLGEPEIHITPESNTISIDGLDNFSLLDGTLGGKLEDYYVIPVGTVITTAVKEIIALTSIVKSPIIQTNSEILPYSITQEPGKTYGDLLLELADILSWVIYFDTDGRLRFEESIDELNTDSILILDESEIILGDYNHRYKYKDVRNYVKVIGDNINGNLATGIAQDNGLFSPTSVSKIGTRTEIINDSNIYSDELAEDRATYELKKLVQIYESIEISIVPQYYLDVGDIIRVNNPTQGLNYDKYLITNISNKLDNDSRQNLTLWKVRDLG